MRNGAENHRWIARASKETPHADRRRGSVGRRSRRLGLLAAATFGLAVACGSPSTTGPEEGDDVTETVAITPQGGAANLLDGMVRLTVPEGALGTETDITVSVRETTGLEGAIADAVFEFEPDGLVFASPVELRIQYDPALLDGETDVTGLRLHEYTSGTPQMVFGSRVDSEASTVTGMISGFSAYGAGETSDDALQSSVDALRDRWVDPDLSPEEREEVGDALHRDIRSLQRRISRQCAATDQIPAISTLLQRIAVLEEMAQETGAEPSSIAVDACGGILFEGATEIRIEPTSADIAIGETVQLEGRAFGPPGELFGGTLEWRSGNPEVASVDPTSGSVEGLSVGRAGIDAAISVLHPLLLIASTDGGATVDVGGPVTLEVSPGGGAVLASQQWTVLNAVVRDSLSGAPLVNELAEVTWSAVDPSVAELSLGTEGDNIPIPNGRKLEGGRAGTTDVQACTASGPTPKCLTLPVRVVWNLNGTWRFQETLTTQLDPPESERCVIQGTVTLVQNGASYSGSSDERATCTFDPGDGTEPEVEVLQSTGIIQNGVVSDNRYSHDITLGGEQCRSSGVLSSGFSNGSADFANGTTECQDDGGFRSSGPSSGEWIGGTRNTRLGAGG